MSETSIAVFAAVAFILLAAARGLTLIPLVSLALPVVFFAAFPRFFAVLPVFLVPLRRITRPPWQQYVP